MDYQAYAVTIRDRIMEAVRAPVTVGIARSKTLAKLISDSAKPFGAKAILYRESEVTLKRRPPMPVETPARGQTHHCSYRRGLGRLRASKWSGVPYSGGEALSLFAEWAADAMPGRGRVPGFEGHWG